MIEYVFFHRSIADTFTARLAALSIVYESKTDELGFVVAVPEDLDEAALDELDALHEELLALSEALLDAAEGGTENQAAALNITLGNGRCVQASVRPALMNKLLAALSFEEINELLEAIVDSIEHPDERPFCRR